MKNLLKPLIVLTVLLAVWAVVRFTGQKPGRPVQSDVLSVQVDTTAANRIEIDRMGQQLVLLRGGDSDWTVQTLHGPRPAEHQQVMSALTTLNDIKSSSLVSHNPDKQAEFRVDTTDGTRVKVFGPGDKLLTDLVVGKIGGLNEQPAYAQRGIDPQSFFTYIRPADSDRVFKVQGFFGGFLGTNSDQWRNHILMDFDPHRARQVELTFPDEKVELDADTSGAWRLTAPKEATPDSSQMQQMLATLGSMRATGFVDSLPPADSLGLDPPQFAARVSLEDGSTQALEVGGQSGENLFYCRVPGKEQVYTLALYRLSQVQKRSADLLKKEEKK